MSGANQGVETELRSPLPAHPSLASLHHLRAKFVAYKTFLECFRPETLDPEMLQWSRSITRLASSRIKEINAILATRKLGKKTRKRK
jgi:hypothetical protein